MLDVFVIADDWRANPITSWTVRAHEGRQELGRVLLEGGRYRLRTVMGEMSEHGGLLEARDFTAALFSPAAHARAN